MKDSEIIIHVNATNGFELLSHFADHQNGMLLCTEGFANFTLGKQHYSMSCGDMLLNTPFLNITFTELSPDFQGTLCTVDLEFVFSAITPINLSANARFVMLNPLSHPSDADTAALISLMDIIEKRSKFMSNRPLSKMMTENLLHALAYMVLDSYLNVCQTETKSSDTRETIMLTFHDNLSRHFATHRKVSHYAKLQNLSTRYFSTTIKELSGHTPLYWINTAVVAEAKRLIRNSNMSIKEIAYHLNFASPTFFTRWYRDTTGETPSHYRTRCRIILSPKQ